MVELGNRHRVGVEYYFYFKKEIAVRGLFLKTALVGMLTFLVFGVAVASDPVRLDGSSDQAALDSFDLMRAELSQKKQADLVFAVLKINMDGVGSASEMLANPALRETTVARIRDRVDGMTAEEIITEAENVTSVQMFKSDQ